MRREIFMLTSLLILSELIDVVPEPNNGTVGSLSHILRNSDTALPDYPSHVNNTYCSAPTRTVKLAEECYCDTTVMDGISLS